MLTPATLSFSTPPPTLQGHNNSTQKSTQPWEGLDVNGRSMSSNSSQCNVPKTSSTHNPSPSPPSNSILIPQQQQQQQQRQQYNNQISSKNINHNVDNQNSQNEEQSPEEISSH